jgi:hypothetical protein
MTAAVPDRAGFCFRTDADALADALRAMAEKDAVALSFLPEEVRLVLVTEAATLAFHRARAIVGEGERAVYQDFDLTVDFPAESSYRAVAGAVDRAIAAAAARIDPPPLPPGFCLDDLILQRYVRGSAGITLHRDHLRYRGLVAILVVSGDGRFGLALDRSGTGAREVAAAAGDLLLMRAPGFAGSRDRPFHSLSDITRERLSFGLRWDSSRAGP